MKTLAIALICFTLPSWANSLIDQSFVDSLPSQGRHHLHGMVVFGNGPYYMTHIPMLNMPHDMQIVTEVTLKDALGNDVKYDFSNATHSIKPAIHFSLNRFAKKELTTFKGDIYKGSFELPSGESLAQFSGVTVSVTKRIVVRPLPSSSEQSNVQLSDGENTFNVNLIDPSRNYQRVDNLTQEKRLWCVIGPGFFSPCP